MSTQLLTPQKEALTSVEHVSKIVEIINKSNLSNNVKISLQEKFVPFSQIAEEWAQKAKTIVVVDESQTDIIKQAREGRLFLKDKRNRIEDLRKELKEDSLREGQTIDLIAKTLKSLIEPTETYLEKQEKFIEIKKAQAIQELTAKRSEEIHPYSSFVPFGLNLGTMNEEEYQKLLSMVKLAKTQKEEDDRKAAEEAEKSKKLNELHNTRISLLSDCLYCIPVEERKNNYGEMGNEEWISYFNKYTQIAIEEDKKRKKLQEENERLRKIQLEKEKEEKLKIANDKKLAKAPDKEKLLNLANVFEDVEIPDMKSDEAKAIQININILKGKLVNYIREKANTL